MKNYKNVCNLMEFTDIHDTYNINGVIGKGTYGKVLSVTKKNNNKKFAIKLCEYNDDIIINPSTLREIDVLTKIKHPHIVQLYKVFFGKYKKKDYVCLLIELFDNTLYEIESNIKNDIYILHILDGLNYLSQSGYIHGDLNFTNILINNTGAHICDFGFSRRVYRKHNTNTLPTLTIRPPELFNINSINNNINTKCIDTWGLCILIYYIIYNQYIFKDDNMKLLKNSNSNINVFINKLIQHNPNKRPNIINTINTDYIKELQDKFKYKFEHIDPIIIYDEVGKVGKVALTNNILFNTIDIVTNIVVLNNLEHEIIFHTIYNFNKIYNSINNIDSKLLCIILFWISNKIISETVLNSCAILKLIKMITGLNLGINNLKKIHTKVCLQLKWNIDPQTSYTYIQYVPIKNRNYFEYMNFIILLGYSLLTEQQIKESIKGLYICDLINKKYNTKIKLNQINNILYKNNIKNIGNIINNVINNQDSMNFLKYISDKLGW